MRGVRGGLHARSTVSASSHVSAQPVSWLGVEVVRRLAASLLCISLAGSPRILPAAEPSAAGSPVALEVVQLLDKYFLDRTFNGVDLMGKKAIEILNEDRAPTTAATSPTTNANKAESPGSAPPRAHSFAAYPAGTLLLSLLSAFASSL